ncbi:hypothetical protein HW555_005653, partial [Spodoptera exigua]
MAATNNPYQHLLKTIEIDGKQFKYYDVTGLGEKY